MDSAQNTAYRKLDRSGPTLLHLEGSRPLVACRFLDAIDDEVLSEALAGSQPDSELSLRRLHLGGMRRGIGRCVGSGAGALWASHSK